MVDKVINRAVVLFVITVALLVAGFCTITLALSWITEPDTIQVFCGMGMLLTLFVAVVYYVKWAIKFALKTFVAKGETSNEQGN
jgi:uncharacterized membrane protein